MWKKKFFISITIFTTILSSLPVNASTSSENTDVSSNQAIISSNEDEQQSLAIPVGNSSLVNGEAENVNTYAQENDNQEQELTDQTEDTWNLARGGGTWINEGGRWWYKHYDGSYTKNGWEEIGGLWYHFDASGWMETEKWISDGGKWYYVDSSGIMAVEKWMLLGGKWYYFDGHGAMVIGWKMLGGKWYYFESSGSMATGWKYIAYPGGKLGNNKYYNYFSTQTGEFLTDSDTQGCNEGYNTFRDHKCLYGLNLNVRYDIVSERYYDTLIQGADAWNVRSRVNLSKGDARNYQVWFTESTFPSSSGTVARTYHYNSDGSEIDADSYNWFNAQVVLNKNESISVPTVAHEFGHVLGLSHRISETDSIMTQERYGRTATVPKLKDTSVINHLY